MQELSHNGKACGKYMISHNSLVCNANNCDILLQNYVMIVLYFSR